jgi:hypothetical protein
MKGSFHCRPGHPFVELGRDYFGASIKGAEYHALEGVIAQAHDRFDPGAPRGEREFPSLLIFSLLEAFVARLTVSHEEFTLDGPAAEQSLRDLVRAVQADTFEAACCRVVSHLTTANSQVVDCGEVRVEPVIAPAHEHKRELNRIISEVISDAASAYGRDDPGDYAPPESVIIALGSDAKPIELRVDCRLVSSSL